MNNGGFVKLLNNMRAEGSQILNDRLCKIEKPSDIESWANVIFNDSSVYNEFCNGLISKLITTQFEQKSHSNKFDVFEGIEYPVGLTIENAYTNPASGIDYDPYDLAGILAVYKADTKVQYFKFNFDKQYRVTLYYDELRQAMLSLESLARYITQLTNTLYSGASIDQKRATVNVMVKAYQENAVHIDTVSAVTSKETAEALLVKARSYYLNFQEEGDEYNSFKLVGGEGKPVTTWTNPDDIYFIIRNDVLAEISIKELANVFHIEEAKIMGKVLGVKDFSLYSSCGEKMSTATDLVGIMCDKAFFDIHKQFMYMRTQENISARATQYILNLRKAYNMNIFANCIAFATATPSIDVEDIEFKKDSYTVKKGRTVVMEINTVPTGATSEVTFTSSDEDSVELEKINDRAVRVKGVVAGTVTITATSGDISDSATLVVTPTKYATDLDFGISELALDTTETLELTITPADSDENIEYSSSNDAVFTVTKVDNKHVTLTEVGSGSATLYAKSKNATAIVTVTVA